MKSDVIIIGNLKMHAVKSVLEEYKASVKKHEFGLLVPYPYLTMAQELLKASEIWVGAQSLSEHGKGAFSSQVSAQMLKELGVRTVMIGHQEVRALGVDVSRQLQQAYDNQLSIVYCVGESRDDYENGRSQLVLEKQLSVLKSVDNLMIAYEPIWSIGTGKVPEFEDINHAVAVIKNWVSANIAGNLGSIKVLYGGSIHNKNCEKVLSHTNIDGFLVGGISLEPKLMLEVVERCS